MYDLSIVLPTCNRAPLLERCINAIRDTVQCSHELIVVDGASTDATPAVLDGERRHLGDRLRVIREDQREGFVRATNKGFRMATGRNLIWLNDDAPPMPGALDGAVAQLDRADANVGLLALFHRWERPRNIAYQMQQNGKYYRLLHVRGTLYANFALGKRETYQRLDYFDERFYVCAADPDLSLKCWHSGLRVEPAWGCVIDHDEHSDDRRAADTARGQEDNEKLFAKWDLPSKNLAHNDFKPDRPCTLRGLRGAVTQAA